MTDAIKDAEGLEAEEAQVLLNASLDRLGRILGKSLSIRTISGPKETNIVFHLLGASVVVSHALKSGAIKKATDFLDNFAVNSPHIPKDV
jgi:hypothetical protein